MYVYVYLYVCVYVYVYVYVCLYMFVVDFYLHEDSETRHYTDVLLDDLHINSIHMDVHACVRMRVHP